MLLLPWTCWGGISRDCDPHASIGLTIIFNTAMITMVIVIIIVIYRLQTSYATTAEWLLSLVHHSSSCVIMHDKNHQEFCAVKIWSVSLSIIWNDIYVKQKTDINFRCFFYAKFNPQPSLSKANNYYEHRNPELSALWISISNQMIVTQILQRFHGFQLLIINSIFNLAQVLFRQPHELIDEIFQVFVIMIITISIIDIFAQEWQAGSIVRALQATPFPSLHKKQQQWYKKTKKKHHLRYLSKSHIEFAGTLSLQWVTWQDDDWLPSSLRTTTTTKLSSTSSSSSS